MFLSIKRVKKSNLSSVFNVHITEHLLKGSSDNQVDGVLTSLFSLSAPLSLADTTFLVTLWQACLMWLILLSNCSKSSDKTSDLSALQKKTQFPPIYSLGNDNC